MYVFRPSARRLRHIVWLTLLAWLFALSAGVVNACVLSLPDAATSGLESANRLESAWLGSNRHLPKSDTHAGPQAHGTTAVGQGDHGQDTGKDPCLKFCSDESKALPKGKSCGSDLTVVFVADVAWYLASAPTLSVASRVSRERPTSRGPPLVIRFLRLTL